MRQVVRVCGHGSSASSDTVSEGHLYESETCQSPGQNGCQKAKQLSGACARCVSFVGGCGGRVPADAALGAPCQGRTGRTPDSGGRTEGRVGRARERRRTTGKRRRGVCVINPRLAVAGRRGGRGEEQWEAGTSKRGDWTRVLYKRRTQCDRPCEHRFRGEASRRVCVWPSSRRPNSGRGLLRCRRTGGGSSMLSAQ